MSLAGDKPDLRGSASQGSREELDDRSEQVTDADFNRIRMIDASGTITTVAGGSATSTQPYGDDGPATEAYLREPSGVFVDASGVIYIAVQGPSRIRKVDASGTITTVEVVGAQAPWLCLADATGVVIGVEYSQEG